MNRVQKAMMIVCALALILSSFTGCKEKPEPISQNVEVELSTGKAPDDPDSSVKVVSEQVDIQEIQLEEVQPFLYENGVLYYNSFASRTAPYSSVAEQADHSDAIVIGKVASSEVWFDEGKVFTVQTVEIADVIKGALAAGERIYVRQRGGTTTYGAISEHQEPVEKEFIDENAENAFSDDTVVVCGIDGHYPLAVGEEALLFLIDCTGAMDGFQETLYGIVRTYDGTFHKMADGVYSQATSNKDGKPVTDSGCWSLTEQDVLDLKARIQAASSPADAFATPVTPDVLYPMVRINGVVYAMTETKLDAEPQESEYAGRILTNVKITERPAQNDEANFPSLNEPYVLTDDGIAMPYNGNWVVFRPDLGNE